MLFLIGTMTGGLMECPELEFNEPYSIVEADTPKKALAIYDKHHNSSFFYGSVICELTKTNRKYTMNKISKYISQYKAEEALRVATKKEILK